MLIIRLQRIGKPKHAHFRLVALEHTTRPQGKFLELLGSYDPHTKDIQVKKDRVIYWQSKGARLSPTVNNLLITRGILQGEKVKAWKPRKKKSAPEGRDLASGGKAAAENAAAPIPAPAA